MPDMRLGVIDVGSNTVHMLIVDAHAGAQPLPSRSHKMELRLSEHVTDEGLIDERGADLLVEFTRQCVELAEDQGAQELLGFVTSAIREAPNGEAVLARVRDEVGFPLTVLSGEKESRVTFLAARRWFGWSSGTLLMIDIGGGSLELAVGMDEDPDAAVSLPLGAGRVTRDLLQGDPPSADQVRAARRQIRAQIASAVRPLTKVGAPDRVVGTSKTIRSLARVCGAAPSSEGPFVRRFLRRDDLADLVPRLATTNAAQRAALPGVSASRAHQLLGGAVVVEAAMDLLDVEELEICPWALREGIILNHLDLIPV